MSGFRPAAMRFFQDLEDDNSREFWLAHADVYEHEVKQPMLALLESLPEKYQPFRLYRMNRDLRFTKDKSPYKIQQGALSEAEGSDPGTPFGTPRSPRSRCWPGCDRPGRRRTARCGWCTASRPAPPAP